MGRAHINPGWVYDKVGGAQLKWVGSLNKVGVSKIKRKGFR